MSRPPENEGGEMPAWPSMKTLLKCPGMVSAVFGQLFVGWRTRFIGPAC